MKHLWYLIGVLKISKKIVRDVITHTVVMKRTVPKTYLLKDKESYIVATSEIDGAHGLPRDIHNFSDEIQ